MKTSSISHSVIALLMVVSGCTSPSALMPMADGVYSLSKSSPTGFTSLGAIRRAAYEDIREFAESKDRVAQVISVNEVPAGFARWPQVEVRFRLVEEEALAGVQKSGKNRKTSVVYDAMGNAVDMETTSVDNSPEEIYEALEELGDLRDRGILTEEEFQREKAKLLKKTE